MRPPKRILIIDANEDRQSITRFALETNMFRTVSYKTVDSARTNLSVPIDAALAYWPCDADMLASLVRDNDCKGIVVAPQRATCPLELFADAVLLKHACAMSDIIERLKYACARKRGPKPKYKPAEVQSHPKEGSVRNVSTATPATATRMLEVIERIAILSARIPKEVQSCPSPSLSATSAAV
jgi:hypothetical protein